MILHTFKKEFNELITLTAEYKSLSESEIAKDYLVVLMLFRINQSSLKDFCIFKGGTSLSKCYPGSINRFSEDLDLTFQIPPGLSDKDIERKIKEIESIVSKDFFFEPIEKERNSRNKASNIWINRKSDQVKLEIGSFVKAEPIVTKPIKSYIQEYLEYKGLYEGQKQFDLEEFQISVLDIRRTFIDKLLAIKRHALMNNLGSKVRHLYDVYKLFQTNEIKMFLDDKIELSKIVKLAKISDHQLLQKRKSSNFYIPEEPYDLARWINLLDVEVAKRYKDLKSLVFNPKELYFETAVASLITINNYLLQIGE